MKHIYFLCYHNRCRNLKNFTRSNCIVNIGNQIIEKSNVVSLGQSFGIYSEHWDIENPIPMDGKEADILDFRIVRDTIEQEVLALLDLFQVPIKKKKKDRYDLSTS